MDVTSLLIFSSIFLLAYLALLVMRKPAGIPPGPKYTLPIIGDFWALIGGKFEGFKTFRKIRKTHGDIFSLYMGRDLTVVINGYDNIHDAAIKQCGLFSDRPNVFLTSFAEKPRGLVTANGSLWKDHRKFVNVCLQEFGFGKSSFEMKIMEEVKGFVHVLSQQEGEVFDIKKTIHASVSNVLFSILCGKHYDYDDECYQHMLHILDRNMKIGTRANIATNCVPFLRYFPGDPLKLEEWNRNETTIRNYFAQLYEEHKATYDQNNCRDFIDYFISEMKTQEGTGIQESSFTAGQLVSVLSDLFTAGSETTATTIRWAILCLLNFPDIQKRLQDCVDAVISTHRFPTLNDKVRLPYVEAFTMEVMRFACVTPVIARAVPKAENHVTYFGYFVPVFEQDR